MQGMWHYMNGSKEGTEMINALINYPTVCSVFDKGYRYGYQGQERDLEIGEYYAFEYRIHDARLGRFLSLDPLERDFPWNSPFCFSENDVIRCIDLEGLEKVALSGCVPPNLIGTPGSNHYTATSVKMFKAQGTRLNELYGFNNCQVSTLQQIITALINETKNHGSISYIAYFGHAFEQGLLMEDQKGFYNYTIAELVKNMQSGLIKFQCNTTVFINGCNTANTGAHVIGNPFAHELCLQTGATVIAATGTMEMVNPKVADCKFKIKGSGQFVKLTRKEVIIIVEYEVWEDNPDKSWWEFWKEDKVKKTLKKPVVTYEVEETVIGTEVDIDDYIPAEKTGG